MNQSTPSGSLPQIHILGGGQLGRMLLQAGQDWGLRSSVLDPDPQCAAANLATVLHTGDFANIQTVLEFAQDATIVTVEIEHVNIEALRALEAKGVAVRPSARVLETIQDKGLQKQFLAQQGFSTAAFQLVEGLAGLRKALSSNAWEYPAVVKLRKGGYDGRGVAVLRQAADLKALEAEPTVWDAPLVLEQAIEIQTEVAVMAARNTAGQTAVYPPVGMQFHPTANLVEYLYCPISLKRNHERSLQNITLAVAEALDVVGVLAVEFFVDTKDRLWINELAPRPHNSGHHTIEANVTSQFAQHLRAILGLPLGATALRQPAVMLNLLGEAGHTGPAHYDGLSEALSLPGVQVHLYNKPETRPMRKMGHVTITANTLAEAQAVAQQVRGCLRVVAQS
jgi:5-(carboxyamino)imidazole ribonucleotide synthase